VERVESPHGDECVNPTGIKALAIKDRPVFYEEVQYHVSRLVDATRVSQGMLFLLQHIYCLLEFVRASERGCYSYSNTTPALQANKALMDTLDLKRTGICNQKLFSGAREVAYLSRLLPLLSSSFLPCLRGSDQAGGA
jgi:hypothetical protein